LSKERTEGSPIKTERRNQKEDPSDSKSSLESDRPNFDAYVKSQIDRFETLGNRYWNLYHICQIIVLVVSAATPLVNAIIPSSDNVLFVKQYTTSLAFIGAISIGILQLTQAYERASLERITQKALEGERNLYNNSAEPYSDDRTKSRKLFVARVERIILNKFNRFYAIGRLDRNIDGQSGTEPIPNKHN
jgi:hypothetical protein